VKDARPVTAMDLDGKIVWQADCGKAWTADPAERADADPGWPTALLREPSRRRGLLDARNGAKIWSLNILEKFNGKNATWASPNRSSSTEIEFSAFPQPEG